MTDLDSLVAQIRDVVHSEAEASEVILGSSLGFRLRRDFPDVDIRRVFGKLDDFLVRYCSDLLVRQYQPGGHVAYLSKVYSPNSAGSNPPRMNPWQAFVRPESNWKIFVRLGEQQLYVATEPESSIDPEVIKLTAEELKDLAVSFSDVAGDSWSEQLRPLLSLEDYWPEWRRVVESDDDLFRKWLRFRAEGIRKALEERTVSLGLPPGSASHLQGRVQYLRERNSGHAKPPGDRHGTQTHSSNLREQIKRAIDQMSESELAQIWLPAGAAFEVRTNSKSFR